MSFNDILTLWFEEIQPAQQFKKDLDFDQLICDLFGARHPKGARTTTE